MLSPVTRMGRRINLKTMRETMVRMMIRRSVTPGFLPKMNLSQYGDRFAGESSAASISCIQPQRTRKASQFLWLVVLASADRGDLLVTLEHEIQIIHEPVLHFLTRDDRVNQPMFKKEFGCLKAGWQF